MSSPLISIGLPVFNGSAMLEDSLEGLSQQSFRDFSVVISDNASTDRTPEIITRFCRNDPRFTVVRQQCNIGAIANFRNVLQAATAPFFLWRSHDDLFNPDYLARLAARLERTPDAVLAAPHVETLRIATGKRRPRPVARLQHSQPRPRTILRHSQAGWIYGLWRTGHIREAFDWATRAITPHIWAWDHLTLFPAILSGQVVFENNARLVLRLNNATPKEHAADEASCRRDLVTRYRNACFDAIDRQGLTGFDRLAMRSTVLRHINRRVARTFLF